MHVPVYHPDGEAKFWLEPQILLAVSSGLSKRRVAAAEKIIREHQDEIRGAWEKHFQG